MANESGLRTDWAEIAAWANLTSRNLHPFEAEAMMAFSVSFSNAKTDFNGKDVPRPYFDKNSQRLGTRISQKVNL